MDDETGTVCEIQGEIVFEWKIKNFFCLSEEFDKYYISPKFYFCGTSWQMWLYPNGQTRFKSEKWISLYLQRMSNGSPVTVDYSFSLKTVDGEIYVDREFNRSEFVEKGLGYRKIGSRKMISRLELIEKKCQVAASNDLIVICTLENSERNAVSGSLFDRYEKISDALREIYLKEKSCDVRLKVKSTIIRAHQLFLKTRSPVFHEMFCDATKINEEGEVFIEDVDFSTMHSLLLLMYSGDTDKLTCNNALSLFAAAVKFDIKDAKEMCSEFIMRNLSVEWVLDVIKLTKSYQDEAIDLRCREYFKQYAYKILKTDNWKRFAVEYPDFSVELLATTVKICSKNDLEFTNN